jgi:Kef-type K+ transport system membrane component KefB
MTTIVYLLIALVAAKLAAELSEQIKVPAVVGEIVAGLIIGPSALGWLPANETLTILGEIGVILLLFDVGLEMDIGELASVGRAALSVAVVGVVAPMAMGFGLGLAFGMSTNEALFVGAALTATSVGITARVFGDLKALATVEARTVLGAAVADDVIGLVILTVVVRLVTAGSVSPFDVTEVVVVAVAFLVGASLIGIRLAPPVFEWLARVSRSAGTLVALALAFTLAMAKLADAARLAPIVGAFVAGISLSRSTVAERVHRELTPVGQLLIPVFFLQIGVNADVAQFVRPAVVGLALALLAVAVAGKLVSPLGMWRSPGDRLLVGLAMIPRGEVGLIFATIGLQQEIFGENVYASVLMVVLATTLLTPPLLRWRLQRIDTRSGAPSGPIVEMPPGGWLKVQSRPFGALVELAAAPPPEQTLDLALSAAAEMIDHVPGPRLLDWLADQDPTPLRWADASRAAFVDLLSTAGPRSWRFLSVSRVLERALPDLAEAVAEREADSYGFDPLSGLDWSTLAELRDVLAREDLAIEDRGWLLLAALISDATGGDPTRSVIVARRTVERLDLGAQVQEVVAGLLRDIPVFIATARSLDAFGEVRDLQLAQHIGRASQARGLLALALASTPGDLGFHPRLWALDDRLRRVFDHPQLAGRQEANLMEARRGAAVRAVGATGDVEARIRSAPRSLVLSQPPEVLAAQAALCHQLGDGRGPVVAIATDAEGEHRRVDVAAPDQTGLLANLAIVLHDVGFDVELADSGTWDDGIVVVSFRIGSGDGPDAVGLASRMRRQLGSAPSSHPRPTASVDWDDQLSPWHTICRVEHSDVPGLLADITTAFAGCRVEVHAAHVVSADGRATNTFDVTDTHGSKLDLRTQTLVEETIRGGSTSSSRRPRWSPFRKAGSTSKTSGAG